MSEALYRKYRPQTFSEVIGQPHIKKTLLNQLKSGKTAHAYLFCGPRGIGKTTLARLVAKSANCLQPANGEPCNTCTACVSINKQKALDIVEIDAASNTGVDNVRENIINNARVASSILKYKVFIIDEVHMLSLSAFNALLKTLEEPPSNIIFILATTEIHKVPDTIISRCQRFDFKKVSVPEILKKLEKIIIAEKIIVDEEVLEKIARNSEGSARDAESLLGQIIVLDEKHITKDIAELAMPSTEMQELLQFFYLLVDKNTSAALGFVNQLAADGVDLEEFNKNLLEFIRKTLLFKINSKLSELEYLDLDANTHQNLTTALEKVSVFNLKNILEILLSIITDLKMSPIEQLPLELAIIKICEPKETIKPSFTAPVVYKKKEEIKAPLFSRAANGKKEENGGTLNLKGNDEKALVEIKEKMPMILQAIRQKNHSLALTLSIAQLVAFSNGINLVFGVKYQFHKERLCDPLNLAILEDVFSEQLGKRIKMTCLVDDKYESVQILPSLEKSDNLETPNTEDVENVWDLAVNTFSSDPETPVKSE